MAIIHPAFGVLPCTFHQKTDVRISTGRKCEFANIGKLHRIQKERDGHGKDLLQPYVGNKANKEFFQAYPEQVDNYQVRSELEGIS